MDITLDVREHGPFFDGELETEIAGAVSDAAEEVARHTQAMVFEFGESSFRTHPSGRWERELRAEHAGTDTWHIGTGSYHDMPYNWWLEGVGSRNATTRFKGYWMWRRATERAREDADAITGEILDRHLAGRT